MPQSLFLGKPKTSKFGPRIATPEEDAAIRQQQEEQWGPITKSVVSVIESIPGFLEGLVNDPTAAKAQWDAIVKQPGGTLGTILGSVPFELVGPIAVAVGGGKNIPNLRKASVEMLKKIDTSAMPEYFNDWATYMLEKYPRVFSHNFNIKETTNPKYLGENVPTYKDPKLSTIKLNSKSDPNTAFHENQHTIQRLKDPKGFTEKYQNEFYHKNPFEINANEQAAIATPKFEQWRDKYNPPTVKVNPEAYEKFGLHLENKDYRSGVVKSLVEQGDKPWIKALLDESHPSSYDKIEAPSLFTKEYKQKPIRFPESK